MIIGAEYIAECTLATAISVAQNLLVVRTAASSFELWDGKTRAFPNPAAKV